MTVKSLMADGDDPINFKQDLFKKANPLPKKNPNQKFKRVPRFQLYHEKYVELLEEDIDRTRNCELVYHKKIRMAMRETFLKNGMPLTKQEKWDHEQTWFSFDAKVDLI